ncbi:hypothetical protein [Streptomyces sp. WAC05292]|uniref:hypothetical protein n=1 Tax=Streptomyces sp. WAC05292 TaxID=2487418 RepID=UPI0021B011E1|nr:hypothetical protein [Streptomyces sp. WAC05292]
MKHDLADLDEQYEVVAGRKAPYTMVPHWITLHEALDPQAKAVYDVLAMHVNQSRQDDVVWPTRSTIAEMLGWSREQSPDKYIQQLEAVGAIDTEAFTRPNGAAGKKYIVHQTPPHGFKGATTVAEWYRRKRQALAAAGPARTPGRPRKAVAPAPAPDDTDTPKPSTAKKATAKKAPAKKATAKKERTEAEVLLDQRAQKGAQIWWDERAPAHVEAKQMSRLTGTPQQRSRKFLALRGMIRGALAVNYDPRQILDALEEMKLWVPSAQQFDAALGRQDGVQTKATGRRGAQPIFKNDQWKADPPAEDETPSAPDLDVFGVEADDAA